MITRKTATMRGTPPANNQIISTDPGPSSSTPRPSTNRRKSMTILRKVSTSPINKQQPITNIPGNIVQSKPTNIPIIPVPCNRMILPKHVTGILIPVSIANTTTETEVNASKVAHTNTVPSTPTTSKVTQSNTPVKTKVTEKNKASTIATNAEAIRLEAGSSKMVTTSLLKKIPTTSTVTQSNTSVETKVTEENEASTAATNVEAIHLEAGDSKTVTTTLLQETPTTSTVTQSNTSVETEVTVKNEPSSVATSSEAIHLEAGSNETVTTAVMKKTCPIEEPDDATPHPWFVCKECKRQFYTLELYKMHLAEKIDNISCIVCKTDIYNHYHLQTHMKEYHSKYICCKYCKQYYANFDELQKHKCGKCRIIIEPKNYNRSNITYLVINDESDLDALLNNDDAEKLNDIPEPYIKCRICQTNFDDLDKYNSHVDSKGEILKCKMCSETFMGVSKYVRLHKHVGETHGRFPYCIKCKEIFNNEDEVNVHCTAPCKKCRILDSLKPLKSSVMPYTQPTSLNNTSSTNKSESKVDKNLSREILARFIAKVGAENCIITNNKPEKVKRNLPQVQSEEEVSTKKIRLESGEEISVTVPKDVNLNATSAKRKGINSNVASAKRKDIDSNAASAIRKKITNLNVATNVPKSSNSNIATAVPQYNVNITNINPNLLFVVNREPIFFINPKPPIDSNIKVDNYIRQVVKKTPIHYKTCSDCLLDFTSSLELKQHAVDCKKVIDPEQAVKNYLGFKKLGYKVIKYRELKFVVACRKCRTNVPVYDFISKDLHKCLKKKLFTCPFCSKKKSKILEEGISLAEHLDQHCDESVKHETCEKCRRTVFNSHNMILHNQLSHKKMTVKEIAFQQNVSKKMPKGYRISESKSLLDLVPKSTQKPVSNLKIKNKFIPSLNAEVPCVKCTATSCKLDIPVEMYVEHRKRHIYECKYCKQLFPIERFLKFHLGWNLQSRVTLYEYYVQDEILYNKIKSDPIKILTEEKIYTEIPPTSYKPNSENECPVCFEQFQFHCQLSKHQYDKKHDWNVYQCSDCRIRFGTLISMTTHSKRHKDYYCDHCSTFFTTIAAYFKHIDDVHGIKNKDGNLDIECQFCLKTKSDIFKIQRHFEKHHLDKLFSCKECHIKVSSKGELIKHLAITHNSKPYKCHSCNFEYSRRQFLAYHLPECDNLKKKFIL